VAQSRADGTHFHLLRRLANTDVLVVDDFGMEVLNAVQRKDLLEVLEDRYGASSTIITSQLEPKEWHAVIGDETIADAVCDHLIHNAHKLRLVGESIRKTKGDLTKGQKPSK
jgi:DNA replication protein DnaC